MSDREEREEHIKRLEAALACEEKQSSGKCSKQTCDDNCALLYEQGNWGEWKETLRYAINSLKTDLKYDLLYEGVDCNNCKNNLHRGDGSTYCATGDGICHYECEEPTTKNDTINDLDDFIEYGKKAFGVELTIKKSDNPDTYEKLFGTAKNDLAVDCVSRQAVDRLVWECLRKETDETIAFYENFLDLPSVTPQEPRKGHWKEEFNDLEGEVRFTCSSCGKYQLFGTDFCYHCGSDNREVEE